MLKTYYSGYRLTQTHTASPYNLNISIQHAITEHLLSLYCMFYEYCLAYFVCFQHMYTKRHIYEMPLHTSGPLCYDENNSRRFSQLCIDSINRSNWAHWYSPHVYVIPKIPNSEQNSQEQIILRTDLEECGVAACRSCEIWRESLVTTSDCCSESAAGYTTGLY